jgi:ribosomal protein S1
MMPNIQNTKELFLWFGIPLGIIVTLALALLIVLAVYPGFRLIIGDCLRLFGWTSKWIRRKSVESELEGTINSFTKDFNSEMLNPLLPNCVVRWVTGKNASTVITPGKAIVKISFSEDHDLNLYNAASSFIESSLIPHVKSFLLQKSNRALDLLMTRNLIQKSKRSALSIFNSKFREELPETKQRFELYEATDKKGLFKRILLQEYYFWGETLGNKHPSEKYEQEAEAFWDWFFDLATRDPEEMSDLSYESENINIGVILFASYDTYNKFGKKPYIRRAFTYASNGCNCIYLLSRGSEKSKIIKEISKDLEETECFTNITKSPDIKIKENGSTSLVTCIALSPSYSKVVEQAWEEIERAKNGEKSIEVNIREVTQKGVNVDVFGLRFGIDNKYLSALEIQDARKYFQINDDLIVNIVDFSKENNTITLSNVDTNTDPKKLIDEFDLAEGSKEATIERIILNNEGLEIGIIIGFSESQFKGFIPRRYATYSRFVNLSEIYSVGEKVQVHPKIFVADYKNFICVIDNLIDPWENINQYEIGDEIEGIIREIYDHYVLCEIIDGLEAVISFDELTWGDNNKRVFLNSINCGDKINAKILDIKKRKKQFLISCKRLTDSPIERYFKDHKEAIVTRVIKNVYKDYAFLSLESEEVTGYLHVSEFMWNYCGDMQDHLKAGQQINVKVLSYDPSYENIRISSKQCYPNNFEEFIEQFRIGDDLRGIIKCVVDDRVLVLLTFNRNLQLEGYVHKSEMSNICFVDDNLMKKIFLIENEFLFTVKRIDEKFKVVELSRKRFLQKNISKLQYGDVYEATVTNKHFDDIYIYGDIFEGLLLPERKTSAIPYGQKIEVILSSVDTNNAKAEFSMA